MAGSGTKMTAWKPVTREDKARLKTKSRALREKSNKIRAAE